jgi:hypothetical protein
VGQQAKETLMSLMTHLVELSEKHRQLERMISDERARPGSDEVKIRRWKHEKLKLKDMMQRMRTETQH